MGNPTSNAILEQIHQVLGNLVQAFNIQQTYVDEHDPRTEILNAAAFEICSSTNGKEGYSPSQLIFGRDAILLIKHSVDWELIRQKKQTQINGDNTGENKHRFDYDYKVGDKVILTNHTAQKYETPYKCTFVITHCFTNGTVNLQCGAIQIKYNIRRIKPYKSDTKVENSNSINMYDAVNI